MAEPQSYRRAMVLVTASSLLVPLIGLVTAPVLTHALGVTGRGEAGAALAPNLLIVGAATLGLPQALTYHIAKRPHLSRVALGWASLAGVALGILVLAGTLLATPYLSAGDKDLARLMVLGTMLALPGIVVDLLRGAASGRQMWTAVAAERVINSVARLIAFVLLAVFGVLDVTNAVLVMAIAPIVAGLAYFRLFARSPDPIEVAAELGSADAQRRRHLMVDLLGFGTRVWLGSVAVLLLSRLSQLLITPLSSTAQLGLFLVSVTISDIPYIVTQTIRDVAFGSNSADSDTARLQSTSRVATLTAFTGSALLGLTLPLWIGLLFGDGFRAAEASTWILLLSSVVAVPGLLAGAGVDAAGRPGVRSAALVTALVVNAVGIFTLVPVLGAVGAALATLVSTLVSTVVPMVAAARILHTRSHYFVIPQRGDLAVIRSAVGAIAARLPGRRRVT